SPNISFTASIFVLFLDPTEIFIFLREITYIHKGHNYAIDAPFVLYNISITGRESDSSYFHKQNKNDHLRRVVIASLKRPWQKRNQIGISLGIAEKSITTRLHLGP